MLKTVAFLQVIRVCIQELVGKRFLISKLYQVIFLKFLVIPFTQCQNITKLIGIKTADITGVYDGMLQVIHRCRIIRVKILRFNHLNHFGYAGECPVIHGIVQIVKSGNFFLFQQSCDRNVITHAINNIGHGCKAKLCVIFLHDLEIKAVECHGLNVIRPDI